MHPALASNLFAIDYLKEHSLTISEFKTIWDKTPSETKKVHVDGGLCAIWLISVLIILPEIQSVEQGEESGISSGCHHNTLQCCWLTGMWIDTLSWWTILLIFTSFRPSQHQLRLGAKQGRKECSDGAQLNSEVVCKVTRSVCVCTKNRKFEHLSIMQKSSADLRWQLILSWYSLRFYAEELRSHLKNDHFLTKAETDWALWQVWLDQISSDELGPARRRFSLGLNSYWEGWDGWENSWLAILFTSMMHSKCQSMFSASLCMN
jgi:hypothetical protein